MSYCKRGNIKRISCVRLAKRWARQNNCPCPGLQGGSRMLTLSAQLMRIITGAGRAMLLTGLLAPHAAGAFPAFTRQTGQNCIACHAGEQYSELTPFGSMFQSTGYTLGTRALPVGVMALARMSRLRNSISPDAAGDFQKAGVSLFQAGNPVSGRWPGSWAGEHGDPGHAGPSFVEAGHDLAIGHALGSTPSPTAWRGVPEWIDYQQARFALTGMGAAPLMTQLGQQASGVSTYASWKNTLYVEIASIMSPNGMLSMSGQGLRDTVQLRLRGQNPYVRLAWTHGWGAHNAMLAVLAMNAGVEADRHNPGGPVTQYRDRAVDGQYQYLLGPHTLTAQLNLTRESIDGGDLSGIGANSSGTLRQFSLRGSYVYRGKFGASLGVSDTSGTSDAMLYSSAQASDLSGASGPALPGPSLVNSPAARIWIPELFWMPVNYLRLGAQYLSFRRFGGATHIDDSAGRDASGTLLIYALGAY